MVGRLSPCTKAEASVPCLWCRHATEAAAITAAVADMGETHVQGRLVVGLVDSGMLCLACDLQTALVHADRDDVLAGILRETVK